MGNQINSKQIEANELTVTDSYVVIDDVNSKTDININSLGII